MMTPVESDNMISSRTTTPIMPITNGVGYENPVILDIMRSEKHEAPRKLSAHEIVDRGRKYFKSGHTRPVEFRRDQLKALLKFFKECRQDIIKAIHDDLRKHAQEVIIGEVDLVENDIRHTIMELNRWAKPQKPEKRLVNLLDGVYVYNDPYGVVLIIGAWNYPILLTLGPLVGAIAGGNCTVLKPSELSPATATMLAELLPRYLDNKALQVYLGGIPETTAILNERFDYIFFTGSTAVGKIVYQAAAKYLTPTTLELGGKSPVYIDETADLRIAAKRILWGKCINGGQTCIAPDYMLCTKEVQENFIKIAEEVLVELFGNDLSPPEDVSKIVTERHYQRLVNFIESNNVALGGKLYPKEQIIAPTILTNVKPDDPVMQEEIFGPILPIINVSSVEEAVDFINERDKPLALYIFSKNKKVQNYILENTSSGAVTVNDTIMHIMTENLPFGGVGGSGMGSYHGYYGFDTFTHQKAVLIRGLGKLSELMVAMRYPPYSDFKINLTSMALKKRAGISITCLKSFMYFLLGVLVAVMIQCML